MNATKSMIALAGLLACMDASAHGTVECADYEGCDFYRGGINTASGERYRDVLISGLLCVPDSQGRCLKGDGSCRSASNVTTAAGRAGAWTCGNQGGSDVFYMRCAEGEKPNGETRYSRYVHDRAPFKNSKHFCPSRGRDVN